MKSQALGTMNWVTCIKYFRRESHQKTDSSRGNDMEKVWRKHLKINEVLIAEKWAQISTNSKVQNLLRRSGPFLWFLVSCFTNNKGLSTLSVKYNKAIFAVIKPHGHDKSKHAKRLTPRFPDTWGTKSDYELYATINRAQCFIKQFIVHKNDKTYLSDRAWRAVLWAAWWKKGQRCLFNILTFKLCAQSTLKKPRVTHIFSMWPNIKLLVTQ